MPSEISQELLAKFEKGLCSEAEYRQVIDWLKSAEATNEHTAFMRKYWQQPPVNIPEPDYGQLFSKINTTVQQGAKTEKTGWRWLQVAATFLGILICSFIYILYSHQNNPVTYQTAFGEQKIIVLPDQSVVELNGNSRLSFKRDWNANEAREVWVEGEGFFSVQHLKNHQKFVVHTKEQLAIEVLGTKFNVLSRRSGTQVVLNSGKIRLTIPQMPSVTMQPGELIQFKNIPADYTKSKVNAGAYSAWKEKKLVLNNTSLSQILTRLQETYGLRVEVSDAKLLNMKGTGTMPAENAEDLLQIIAETFELKVTRTSGKILLEPAPDKK